MTSSVSFNRCPKELNKIEFAMKLWVCMLWFDMATWTVNARRRFNGCQFSGSFWQLLPATDSRGQLLTAVIQMHYVSKIIFVYFAKKCQEMTLLSVLHHTFFSIRHPTLPAGTAPQKNKPAGLPLAGEVRSKYTLQLDKCFHPGIEISTYYLF